MLIFCFVFKDELYAVKFVVSFNITAVHVTFFSVHFTMATNSASITVNSRLMLCKTRGNVPLMYVLQSCDGDDDNDDNVNDDDDNNDTLRY